MTRINTSRSKPKTLIGRVTKLSFPVYGLADVPARVDTGATTSSVWASDMSEEGGILRYVLFDRGSPFYTGEVRETTQFQKALVASSIGERQKRYKVRLVVRIKGKKINAQFTLADRAKRAYPVLVGRNVLRGKFVVDVQGNKQLYH